MRRVGRWRRWVPGLSLVLLAACQRQAAEPLVPTATVPTAPPRTTTTNPYTIPAVIDVEYVNRVLAGLDQATGDIFRLVMRTRTIPPEAIERLKTVYADPLVLQLRLDGYQDDIAGRFTGYRPEPGNRMTTVAQLLSVSPTCVFARVSRDSSAVSFQPDPRFSTQWIAIKPKQVNDFFGYNPTLWAYVYDGFNRGFVAPANPCAGS